MAKNIKAFFLLIIGAFICIKTQPNDQTIDKETSHIKQFAQTMADFIPTETFTFELAIGEQITLGLWPASEVQKIRGVFYVDDQKQQDELNGQGLFVGCEVNGVMEKKFVGERLGVFNLVPNTRPSNVKLIFKSDSRALKIYLSYQLRTAIVKKEEPKSQDQNVPTKEEEGYKQSQSKLDEITSKFDKVKRTVESQQNALRMIVKHVGRHSKRLGTELEYATMRIVLQTGLVFISGLVGMWILKKQLSSGYQLLV